MEKAFFPPIALMFRGKHSVTRHGDVFTLERGERSVVHGSGASDEVFTPPEARS